MYIYMLASNWLLTLKQLGIFFFFKILFYLFSNGDQYKCHIFVTRMTQLINILRSQQNGWHFAENIPNTGIFKKK